MIGVDIEAINRFNKLGRRKDKNFLKRIFSPKELEYCYSKKNPTPHLAVRFAGKEAVTKALLSAGWAPLPHHRIEILNTPNGAPQVRIDGGRVKDKDYAIKISLSHDDEKAIAFVIILAK